MYDEAGAASDGVSGFLTGEVPMITIEIILTLVSRYRVGTLSKPAIGVLDLATGAANAVRENSRSAHRSAPAKVRVARVVQGPGGFLALYSEEAINGRRIYVEGRHLRTGPGRPGESSPLCRVLRAGAGPDCLPATGREVFFLEVVRWPPPPSRGPRLGARVSWRRSTPPTPSTAPSPSTRRPGSPSLQRKKWSEVNVDTLLRCYCTIIIKL